MIGQRAATVVTLLALASCATTNPDSPVAIQAVELAATASSSDLRNRAEAGEAIAQLAWSLVLAHGLRGAVKDPRAAKEWRLKATASRGQTQVMTYAPRFGADSSRVDLIPLPKRDVTKVEAVLATRCAAALAKQVDPKGSEATACGTPQTFGRLKTLWPA